MYSYIMHYLNFFLLCLIKNLALASLSLSFTIKSDVNFPFLQVFYNFHSGLQSIEAISENQLHNFLISSRHPHEKYCFHNCTL